MTALELFKKAGLEDYLSNAGIGAGVGAAGFGAASYMNADKNKSTSDKLKDSLMSALKGGVLGGVTGAGVTGAKELYNSIGEQPDVVSNLLKKNPNLSSNPYGEDHPAEALVGSSVSAANGPLAGLLGALGWTGKHLKDNISGERIAAKATSNAVDATDGKGSFTDLAKQIGNEVYGAAAGTGGEKGSKDRGGKGLLSGLFNATGAASGNTNEAQQARILEQIYRHAPRPANTPQSEVKDGLIAAFKAMNPSGLHDAGAASAANNAVENVKAPTSNALRQYGLRGLGGMGVGMLAGKGLDETWKSYIQNKYPEDQLKIWNQLANKK